MPGTLDLTPPTVPLARQSAFILVFRYHPTSFEPYEYLPNIFCLSIRTQEDGHPWNARFRYSYDPILGPDFPQRVEEVWGPNKVGWYIVQPNDRLVVRAYPPDAEDLNDFEIMFDGFALIPQANMAGSGEAVTFEAVGTPERLYDRPITGAVFRNADNPAGETTTPTRTWLPVRFNPEGEPNATPDGHDDKQGTGSACPLFLDHLVKRVPDERRHWTLGMAARYLLYKAVEQDAEWDATIILPDASILDMLLESWEPNDNNGAIDPNDPTTYTTASIEVPDLDVTGEKMTAGLNKLIKPHGFVARFELDKDDVGDPTWQLVIARSDSDEFVFDLKLQPVGSSLNPALTNLGGLSIQFDGEIENACLALTAPTVFEASWVLAPVTWYPVATDVDDANRAKWKEGESVFEPNKFRLWGVDETGDGHATKDGDGWSNTLSHSVCSFDNILGEPQDGKRAWAVRRRPGKAHILTKEPVSGEHRPSALYVSVDYQGPPAAEWDGTGTWQEVTTNNWEVLKDRLGIRLNATDARDWYIGMPPVVMADSPFPGGVVDLVRATAAPDAVYPRVFLRLLTVAEGDKGVGAESAAKASRRAASPIKFEVIAADEVRDRFRDEVRMGSSPYVTGFGTPNAKTREWLRDDLEKTIAHTQARRRANELSFIAGSATIPRLSLAYKLGDRIRKVAGRNILLDQNLTADPKEGRLYPRVVGIDWQFEQGQSTTLHLSDRRAEPPAKRRR